MSRPSRTILAIAISLAMAVITHLMLVYYYMYFIFSFHVPKTTANTWWIIIFLVPAIVAFATYCGCRYRWTQ